MGGTWGGPPVLYRGAVKGLGSGRPACEHRLCHSPVAAWARDALACILSSLIYETEENKRTRSVVV